MNEIDMRALILRVETLEEWLSEVCKKAEVNRRVLLANQCKKEIRDLIDKFEEEVEEEL